jgi:hypothetical protein
MEFLDSLRSGGQPYPMQYLLMSLLVAQALGADYSVSAGPHQTMLVELYTSEGCSSCPPADRWLSQLRRRPQVWRDFVPIGFHVSYWDYLGWKDALAQQAYSQRQRNYAASWRSRRVYTPGLVVNGEEAEGFSLPPLTRKRVGTLQARLLKDRRVVVEFSPGRIDGKEWTAHVVLLGFDIESPVRGGENHGKILTHDFAALSMESGRLRAKGKRQVRTLRLPEISLQAPRYGLAVWVTRRGAMEPVQAAGSYLPSDAKKLIESPHDKSDRHGKESPRP